MEEEYRIVLKPDQKGIRIDSYQVRGDKLSYFETVGYADTVEKAKEIVQKSRFYAKRRIVFEQPCAR